MIVVNIFGVPGSGKSTATAYIYYKLKEAGVNVELVTEFAKDLVWEDNTKAISNQLYIAGNQYYRLSKLEDKVDVAITDSPLLLQPVYYKFNKGVHPDLFEILIYNIDNQYENLNYVLPFPVEVNPSGRIHDKDDSYEIYKYINEEFKKFDVKYLEIKRDETDYDMIIEDVIRAVEKYDKKGEDD